MRLRISKRSVDAVLPGPKDIFLWDSGDGSTKGFGLKVTPRGRRVYIFQYRMAGRGSPTQRYTIGEHGAWTPDKARSRAEALERTVSEGIDPLRQQEESREAERRRQVEAERAKERAFADFAERFIERRVAGLDSGKLKASILRRRFIARWGDRDLATITRVDVGAALDAIADEGTPSAAWNALRAIRPLFGYAVERGLIEVNPASKLRPDATERSRSRVLSDAELVEIWAASGELAYPFGAMVRLLMLTGQRRNEVAGMAWPEVDLEGGLWAIPGERTKNEQGHIVHLAPQAVDVVANLPRLSEAFVFSTTGTAPVSGFSKAKLRLDAELLKARRKKAADAGSDPARVKALPEWTLHDLRRTMATGLAHMGVLPHVTEKILNHNPKALSGVAGIYNRHEYLAERKVAIEAWARRIEGLVGGLGDDNVLPFAKAEGGH